MNTDQVLRQRVNLQQAAADARANELRSQLDLVGRAFRVRKLGLVPVLWIDCDVIRVSESDLESPRRISWDELRLLVEDAEALVAAGKKPVARELGARSFESLRTG